MPRPLVLTALVAIVLGCNALETKVSQSALESALRKWLKDNGLKADGVHCPGDQPMKEGHTFECRCEIRGSEIPVTVKVTDPSSGTVEWEPKYIRLERDAVEREILASETLAGRDLKLDCEDAVWVSIPDSVWKCHLTDNGDGGKQYVVTVKFLDGDGNNEMNVDPK
jgi:hypothetical protein